jgi:hypothetical protein
VVGSGLLVGAVTVVEWRRRAAIAHEEAITAALSTANAGAGKVHATMDNADLALSGLSYAAEAALSRKVELAEDAADALHAPMPANVAESPVYRRKVTLQHPSFAGLTDADPAFAEEAQKLTNISYAFSRPLVDSATDDRLGRGKRLALVTETGAPVRWVRIATRSGLLATMPASGGFTSGVDTNRLPWLRDDSDAGPRWGDPHIDPDGQGLVVTGTRPLFGNARQIGTAAIDLTAQALVDELAPPAGAKEAMLVDQRGKVVLWGGMPATTMSAYAPRDLPIPELMLQITRRREGVVEVGGRIAAWAPIDTLGWRYLVLFDEAPEPQRD